jgi:hypothetical protein
MAEKPLGDVRVEVGWVFMRARGRGEILGVSSMRNEDLIGL